jgi:hypothetical protein
MQRQQQSGMQNLMKSRDKRLNRKLQKQYANRNNWQDRRNQVGSHKASVIVILVSKVLTNTVVSLRVIIKMIFQIMLKILLTVRTNRIWNV